MKQIKKRKTILIVPSQARSVKAFRVRFSIGLLFIIIVLTGFFGFFIPFNNVTLDVAKQNQKRNLAEQNRLLSKNLDSSLVLLRDLRDQISLIEEKRDATQKITGLPDDLVDNQSLHQSEPQFNMTTDQLLEYLSEKKAVYQSLIFEISEENNVFERIPVIKPIPNSTVITRRYGMARDPFTGKQKMHHGIDFAGEIGTPVIATASGVVSRVENDPIWGRKITINHRRGYRTVYAHLGSVSVGRGRRVQRGDVIGTIGLSGLTTGPHVHYEILKNNKQVNPEDYFFPQVDIALDEVVIAEELLKEETES
ncbi:Peptidase, M23/M37 family [Chitinispirillum alkaliphilum]|nr:Peptidase, M23/M37 family [Chitinispirillum alkaliphilum]